MLCWHTQSFCFRRGSCPCWMTLEGGCIYTCKIKNMFQSPWDILSGNRFKRSNCSKQQLIFPIPNVLGSLNIQINVLASTQILWRCKIEILFWWSYFILPCCFYHLWQMKTACKTVLDSVTNTQLAYLINPSRSCQS